MHREAMDYVRRFATKEPLTIVEIGSRDINGSVRGLFPNANYTGLDLYPGKGVDVVVNACDWKPPQLVDMVICCEVLEHASDWEEIIATAASWLKLNGTMVITCANPERPGHSHIDGGKLRPGEYYAGLWPSHLCWALQKNACGVQGAEIRGHDTYVSAFNMYGNPDPQSEQGPS